ncbi:MAG: hypothetical protein H6Q86_2004 [candidate division NC10 bacterium]|nr:hypothetical protein [candidate division NC10 bacterium]
MNREAAPPEGRPERLGRVQDVRFPHEGGKLAEEALDMLRDGLHVRPFPVGRLVAVDVVDADAVGCGGEGARERLQRPRSDGGDDRRRLAVQPLQRSGGVGHGGFVAEVEGPREAGRLVDPEHLREVGGPMPEHRQVLPHALFEKPEDQPLSQRRVNGVGKHAATHRQFDVARLGDRPRSLLHGFQALDVLHRNLRHTTPMREGVQSFG